MKHLWGTSTVVHWSMKRLRFISECDVIRPRSTAFFRKPLINLPTGEWLKWLFYSSLNPSSGILWSRKTVKGVVWVQRSFAQNLPPKSIDYCCCEINPEIIYKHHHSQMTSAALLSPNGWIYPPIRLLRDYNYNHPRPHSTICANIRFHVLRVTRIWLYVFPLRKHHQTSTHPLLLHWTAIHPTHKHLWLLTFQWNFINQTTPKWTIQNLSLSVAGRHRIPLSFWIVWQARALMAIISIPSSYSAVS